MRMMILTCGALALTGCAEGQQVADAVARQSAKAVVSQTLTSKFPGLPKSAVTPATDCVIDNANATEILTLAQASVLGVTDTTVQTTNTILNRAPTQTCIARASINALLNV